MLKKWPALPTLILDSFKTGQEVSLQPVSNETGMHMAIVSGDNRTYLALGIGYDWSSPEQLFAQSGWGTHTPMTFAYFRNEHHLFLTNYAGEVFWTTSPDGMHWPPAPTYHPFDLWKTEKKINALVNAAGDTLLLALVNELGTPQLALYDGAHWVQPEPLFGVISTDWPTDAPVTLAYFQGLYYAFLVRREQSAQGANLYFSTSSDGLAWGVPVAVPKNYWQFRNVIHPVNLWATGDALFMTIVDKNKKPWLGSYDGKTWADPQPLFQTAGEQWETRSPVSITHVNGALVLVVMSGNHQVYAAIQT